MILVGTSVWIRFFSDRAPYAEELARLIRLEEVAGHELVYGELLIGDPGGGRKPFSAYAKILYAKAVAHSHVVDFVQDRKLHGRGVSRIDVHLLASALIARTPLWTADAPLTALAEELGIRYRPR